MRTLFPFMGSTGRSASLISTIIHTERYKVYCEPMVGGGAVFFKLTPRMAILNDIEPLVADVYRAARDYPNKLTEHFGTIPNDRDSFYSIQDGIRAIEDPVLRAATFHAVLILAYNGVMKFDKEGIPHMTWGDRGDRWDLVCPMYQRRIIAASQILQGVTIFDGDYRRTKDLADMYFFDPPWVRSQEDYGRTFDHEQLSAALDCWGARWLLTIDNDKDGVARKLYLPISKWSYKLNTRYTVAPTKEARRRYPELLIANFEPRVFR